MSNTVGDIYLVMFIRENAVGKKLFVSLLRSCSERDNSRQSD